MNEAVWHVQFTEMFRKDVLALQKAGMANWLDKLERLKDGPFRENNNIKPLATHSKLYRWRVGKVRVFIRLLKGQRTLLLTRARLRKDAYDGQKSRENGKPIGNIDELQEWLSQRRAVESQETLQLGDRDSKPAGAEEDLEEIFLDESELFLIGIDREYWPALLELTSFDELDHVSVPESVRSRIVDYVTAPAQHHVGKIYQLAGDDTVEAIAKQPLARFLVALDPMQENIVGKPLDKGPYMIRGGPGTGKTLVNIARIRRAYQERAFESLLDSGPARIGFITYNKALSQGAKSMLSELMEESDDFRVEFRTLDSLVFTALKGSSDLDLDLCEPNEDVYLVQRAIDELSEQQVDQAYVDDFLSRKSPAFIAEEIESVLLGNGLKSLDGYLEYRRVGRKAALQPRERQLIWMIFEQWRRLLQQRNRCTFASRRLDALERLESGQGDVEPYDALFVDELQDLPVVAIRLLEHFVTHPSRLNFAADTAQSIYLKAPSWSGISKNLRFHRGNSFILERSYRMTREIAQAIAPLRTVAAEEDIDSATAEFVFSGPRPVWIERGYTEHARCAAEVAWELIQEDRINPGQVAIIGHDNKDLNALMEYMEEADVPVGRVDGQSALQLDASHVHVMTAHAAKGLEFPIVIVPWVIDGTYPHRRAMKLCQDDAEKEEEYERSMRLLYVALSRAARRLYMVTDPACQSPFLARLDRTIWDVQQAP